MAEWFKAKLVKKPYDCGGTMFESWHDHIFIFVLNATELFLLTNFASNKVGLQVFGYWKERKIWQNET